MSIRRLLLLIAITITCSTALLAQKPKLTLDDFFNSVTYPSLDLSPDGNAVVIETERADWDQQIFRKDLWLYRSDTGSLIQLTQSGHDSEPKWSPDGKWIAFLSERKTGAGKSGEDADSDSKEEETSQIYLISPSGGEAFAITEAAEDVHSFAWARNSQSIYFATRQPWTKAQKDEYKQQWKDAVEYRTAERGDTIFALDLNASLARHSASAARVDKKEGQFEQNPDLTPGTRILSTLPLRADSLVTSPDGASLAVLTNAINQRQEKYEDVELYVLDLNSSAQPRRITKNQGIETRPRWASDSRHIFFTVEVGDVNGPYRDLQPHLYWVDISSGSIEQWDKSFIGPVEHYALAGDKILTSARIGTEVQMYDASKPADKLHRITNWSGTYAAVATSPHSPKLAFIYSSLGKPE